jgi:hypothetical protein
MKKIILIIILITAMTLQVNAFNDPGHDSLYVLKIGDSTIIGSLNITQNLTTRQLTAQERVFSPYLIIKGDGDPAGAAINRIVGTDAGLEISSLNELRLNTGVGGIVKIGTSGVPTGLNVTGSIWSGNTLVCLANGTNCPDLGEGFEGTLQITQGGTGATTAEAARTNLEAARTGNCPAGHVVMNTTTSGVQCVAVGTGDGSVTSITAGTGLTGGIITESGEIAFNTTWGDNRYYTQTNANSAFVSISGDTMTNFLTLHANPTANLHAATKQYVDSAISGNMSGVEGSKWVTGTGSNIYRLNGFVGIGTASPTEALTVNGNVSVTGTDVTLFVRSIQTNSGDSLYLRPSGGGVGIRINNDAVSVPSGLVVGTQSLSNIVQDGLYVVGNVGIGTHSPTEKLTVSGNMSVTDNAMMKLIMFSENNNLGMYANETDIIIGNISAFI